jgi:hypothetical protein
MANADVKQLLLQVDASVALAQRNIAALTRTVDGSSTQMQNSLKKVDAAFEGVLSGMTPAQTAKFFANAKASAEDLLSTIDPLYKAQLTYNRSLEQLNALQKAGTINSVEFARAQGLLKQQLAEQQVYFGRVTQGSTAMRIGMQQLSFQIGDIAQGFALGTRPMTIFAQQSGQVIQAMQLMGHSGKGFLAFLAGPWGIGISVAASLLLLLTQRHKEAGASVDSLLKKMRDQAAEARNQEVANEIWAHSLDAVIQKEKELHKELEDTLKVESDVSFERLQTARDNLAKMQNGLNQLIKKQKDAQKELRDAQALPSTAPGAPAYAQSALAAARDQAIAKAQQKLDDITKKIADTRSQIASTQTDISNAQFAIGEQVAGYATDQGKAFSDLVDTERGLIEQNKALASSSTETFSALERLRESAGHAANQDLPLGEAGDKLHQLVEQLRTGKSAPAAFAAEVNKMANALEAAAKAAEEANKKLKQNVVSDFKSSMIGAEGTGPNQMGSSAAGFGQFTKDTWLHYFDRLFPDKAALDTSAKLAMRNVKEVATAVIDKATDDYVKVLKSAGVALTKANLYAVHLLGEPDARKLFGAADNTPTTNLFSPEVLSKNPFLKGTAGSAREAIASRIGDSSSAVSSGAVALERALQEEARVEKKQFDDYIEARDRLNERLLDAQSENVDNAQIETQNAIALIEAEKNRLNQQIDNDVSEGRYGDATEQLAQQRGEELKLINEQIADQRIANARFKEQQRNAEQRDKFDQADFEQRIDALRSQESLARTSKERRALELQVLELVYEEKKKHLEMLFNLAMATKNYGEAAIAAQELANLPNQKFYDTQQALRSTQGPMDRYLDSLPRTEKDINERIQGIEVDGIQHAVDVLAEFRHGWKSMRDAAISALDDIIGKLVKLRLDEWVGKIFKSGKVAGTAGAGGATDAAALQVASAGLNTAGAGLNTAGVTLQGAATNWTLVAAQLQEAALQLAAAGAASGGGGGGIGGLGALAGLIAGGGGAGGAGDLSFLGSVGGEADLLYDPSLLGLADGGLVRGPGTGTSDSVPIMGSNGEYMIQAAAVRKFGPAFFDALNEGRIPHLKDGGLLGMLKYVSPAAFLQSKGLLKYVSPAAMLASSHSGRDLLKFASPFAALAFGGMGKDILKAIPQFALLDKLLGGHKNGSVPNIPSAKVANVNSRGGDTYNVHVNAPITGVPLQDRQTGMQFAAGVEAGLARRRAKGIS